MVVPNIFRSGIVVSPRQLAAQIRIDLVDQRAIIGNENLDIEAVFFHKLGTQLKIPSSFLERMDLVAVTVVSRDVARQPFAEANIKVAGVLFDFDVSLSRMGNLVDKT